VQQTTDGERNVAHHLSFDAETRAAREQPIGRIPLSSAGVTLLD
jgi:hypothetical protein